MSDKLRIIFYGTPHFAVASLESILNAGFDVVAVVTSPDRKAGRGMKLTPSPVKEFALKHHLDVLQPTNLKSDDFEQSLRSYNPNIQVVIAFRMLPEKVWNYPELGTINLHASLLPNYRGAAPINWAVINGEKKTGVTTFRLKHEIDTGNMLDQAEVEIHENDTAGTMHDKLMIEGSKLIVNTLQSIEEGESNETPQLHSEQHHHAPKIFKDDCVIDWNKPAAEVHNLVRGLSPYPVARTSINGKTLKIFHTGQTDKNASGAGNIESDNQSYIHVSCADKVLSVLELQLEGKKKMSTADFLRGFDISEISHFS